jgi:hypothetical protein
MRSPEVERGYHLAIEKRFGCVGDSPGWDRKNKDGGCRKYYLYSRK